MSRIRLALDPTMFAPGTAAGSLAAAGDAGFSLVELGNRPDVLPAFGPPVTPIADLEHLGRLGRNAGVDVASVAVIQAWSSPDEEERRRAVEWWRAGIDAAAALGARRINTELSGDLERSAASRTALLRSIEELSVDIERAEITVAVEPHPNDFVETTAAALDVIEAAAAPWLHYLHCLPHVFHLGGSAADQIQLAEGRLDHIHVADTFRPERTILNPPAPRVRVHQHLDPGQGEMDFDEVALALGPAGFAGLLTVQVFAWPDRAIASFRAGYRFATRFAAAIDAARPPAPPVRS